MSKNARSLTIATILVIVIVFLLWGGGHWLWHQLLVMHGMAK